MRRTIRLSESELRQMIAESVRRVLNEFEDDFGLEDDAMDDEYPFDKVGKRQTPSDEFLDDPYL